MMNGTTEKKSSTIEQQIESLIEKKKVKFSDSEITQELNMKGYLTLYSYFNFVGDVKHFFRNNGVMRGNPDKYSGSEYCEWKAQYEYLRSCSFKMLEYTLMMESTLFSAILETCINKNINTDSKFSNIVKSIDNVKKIESKLIEKRLKELNYEMEDYSLVIYIKEYTYDCLQRLSYSELVKLVRALCSEFGVEVYEEIMSLIIDHPRYKSFFSYGDIEQPIVINIFSGELVELIRKNVPDYLSLANTLESRKFFLDDTKYYGEFDKIVRNALEKTIRNHCEDGKYFYENLYDIFESIDDIISRSKFTSDIDTQEFRCNMESLTMNHSSSKTAALRKSKEYIDNYNIIVNGLWRSYMKYINDKSDKNLIKETIISKKNQILDNPALIDDVFKDAIVNEEITKILNVVHFYKSKYAVEYCMYRISIDFRNHISHGKTFVSTCLHRSDRDLKKALLRCFERENIISKDTINNIIKFHDYYSI